MTTVAIPDKPTGAIERSWVGVNGNNFSYANWEERDAVSRKMVPTGGYFYGKGLAVRYQNGPVGPGNPVNGCQVEDLLMAARARILHFQGDGTPDSSGECACPENAGALEGINYALAWLDARTSAREKQGVEGSNLPHETDTSYKPILSEPPPPPGKPAQMLGNPLHGPGQEPEYVSETVPEIVEIVPESRAAETVTVTIKPALLSSDDIDVEQWSERYYNAFRSCLEWQDRQIGMRMPHESRQKMAHFIAKKVVNRY